VPVTSLRGTSTEGRMQPDGDVEEAPSYQFSPDSQRVTYVADQETDVVYELFLSSSMARPVYLPLIMRE